MAEPERKCSTCKFYEPAPIWRKGWCRNPLLYAPQQSHLVAEDDLDCSRGLSDYWEAADGTGPNAGVNLAMSGHDLFDRGQRGPAEPAADAWGSNSSSYGGGRGTYPPEDDGYAPHESTPPATTGSPRYAGSVGEPEVAPNPWDNQQPGYAAPPAPGAGEPGYGTEYTYGYGAPPQGQEQQNPWQNPPPGGYEQGGYGQEQQGYGQGYPQGGYGQGYQPGGYGQGQGGYDQGGYGAAQPPTGPTNAGTTGTGPRRVVSTPATAGKERSLSYYTEERYWTDYLKLVIPVVVVIALLVGVWFIGTGKLRGGSSDATVTPGAAGGTSASGTTTGTRPAGTPAGTTRPGTPTAGTTTTGVIVPGGTAAVGTGQATLPAGAGTPAASTGGTKAPTLPVKRFKVANTDGAGVNMRDKPDVAGKLVATIAEGTEVQATEGPVDGTSGGTWYKVQAGDKTGYIRSDFLKPVDG